MRFFCVNNGNSSENGLNIPREFREMVVVKLKKCSAQSLTKRAVSSLVFPSNPDPFCHRAFVFPVNAIVVSKMLLRSINLQIVRREGARESVEFTHTNKWIAVCVDFAWSIGCYHQIINP